MAEKLDYQPGVFTVERHVPDTWASLPPASPIVASTGAGIAAVIDIEALLPYGVAIDLRGIEPRNVDEVIEVFGRLACSTSTKLGGLTFHLEAMDFTSVSTGWQFWGLGARLGSVCHGRVCLSQSSTRSREDPGLGPQRLVIVNEETRARPIPLVRR